MARLIPADPFPESAPELVRLFYLLRRLPDDVVVTQRLLRVHGPGPDFWLERGRRVLLLAVCAATPQAAQRVHQADLFQQQTLPVGEADEARLQDFCAQFATSPALPTAVLFPNLTQKQAHAIRPSTAAAPWVGKETLTPDAIAEWVNGRWSAPLSPDQIDDIRRRFVPEVVVPPALTTRPRIERRTEARFTPYLLDYNQEQAVKMDLSLSASGQKMAQDFGLRLINGVAGSGKSLIILYRAHLLRQVFPQKKLLILTHNRALIDDLRRRYHKLSGGDSDVTMLTFLSLCWRQLRPLQSSRRMISYRERLELATQVRYDYLRDTAVSEQMLLEEIDWYKDRLLFSLEDYVAADRSGRGFALNQTMRERVYAAMAAYHQKLQKRQQMDWGDVPRQVWRFAESGELTLPRYDFVLVDEAQFFAPLWFELIKRLLTPDTGHLFLVADASQGFLKRGQSWLSSGLDVRGRVHRLTKSYRTTREILAYATNFYHRRLPDDLDAFIPPDLAQMPTGQQPKVEKLTSEQDEVTRVINEIRALRERGAPWAHLLLIHVSREEIKPILTRLNQAFDKTVAVDPTRTRPQKQIRVCSLNAATGLESPIVFLMGAHRLLEMEQSIRLSPEERVELIRDNTRKLYMAMTRAGNRLLITYVGDLPDSLQQTADS